MKKDSMKSAVETLLEALELAQSHLDYCGYGDAWERECAQAQDIEGTITAALEAGRSALKAGKEIK